MDNTYSMPDKELASIIGLFTDDGIIGCRCIDTGRGENDFRLVVLVQTSSGRLVVKLADNDFTNAERIEVWQRTASEYRGLGYYAPEIYADRKGQFPTVSFRGRSCTAYAEEYSVYKPAEDRMSGGEQEPQSDSEYMREAWIMTAKAAAKHFDHAPFPSAYCMFETFCPSDKTDEVLEAALEWKQAADALPEQYAERVGRLWQLWLENRIELESIYRTLPRSVFQGDLNSSNILLGEDGSFKGVCDFNLCGREVVIKYLMGENNQAEPEKLFRVLEVFSQHYGFSEAEKNAVLPIYRCITPFWWCAGKELRDAEGEKDKEKIDALLGKAERILTEDIDFKSHMTDKTHSL